ncbi:MAG: TRAP transporter large permease subunit [Pseudomonadota bacterium]
MEIGLLSIILLIVLFAQLGLGVWVGFSLIGVGWVALELASGVPIGAVFATKVWGALTIWDLTALPMFIWMGELLLRSNLSRNMFEGLAPFTRRLPGGLLHVNILGCAIFAAVSGSSAATTATIGRMSIPELRARGYGDSMILGTLAGSGTFGFLIPPSIILIVYGAATDQSIARLFIAGLLPGLMLAVLFAGYTAIWSVANKSQMPARAPRTTMREKLIAASKLAPAIGLIIAVIGSIYAGLASPTEAAVIGVAGALVLAWLGGSLTRNEFMQSLLGATRTSCMIAFILAGAAFLTVAMGYTGIPRTLAAWIGKQDLSAGLLLAALVVFFIVLGCFLDGISLVVLTTSVILPMVLAAGIDPIWFGIFLVVVVEMSQITPPVGFNLFVIQGITGENIFKIARHAAPFFGLMVVAIILLYYFPEIALWLPETMLSN